MLKSKFTLTSLLGPERIKFQRKQENYKKNVFENLSIKEKTR